MISAKVTGLNTLSKVYDRAQYKDEELRARLVAGLYGVKEYIEYHLQKLFSHHNEQHFLVELNFGGAGSFNITIYGDDIGTYIYYGTEEHNISSSGPMPLWEGTAFANSVSHPGQDPRKEEIDEIVAEAFTILWTTYNSAGGGGTIWAY